MSEIMFLSHGRQYIVDEFGVIHQLDYKKFTYDENYVSTYDTDSYRRGNEILQALRWGFVIGSHGAIPKSILDIGYGNGAFLKAGENLPVRLMGKDVTGLRVPGVQIVEEYVAAEVYTFHDCFEHIPDLSFIANVPAHTVIISLPYCHYHTQGLEWFSNNYKHRKPDEHLHHFCEWSLHNLMKYYGYRLISTSTHEDLVRRSVHGLPNILSMAFRKR